MNYTPGRPGPDDDTGYGGFHISDPRDFFPDPECSTPEEREAHRIACEKAERGEPWDIPAEEHGPWVHTDGRMVLGERPDGDGWRGVCTDVQSFGLGQYIIRGGER